MAPGNIDRPTQGHAKIKANLVEFEGRTACILFSRQPAPPL